MPEGYYSSGPNTNLRRFVEEHAKSYDPALDKYEKKPFNEPIVDEAGSAIYDMHPYWSKKPHGAIKRYILHYTKEGDVVLDPFTGSGGTNSVACQVNRPNIGIDISPASTFITRHLCTPHNPQEIKKTLSKNGP
jgi:DNA modification methylase